jgi:hypothetical protein
MILVYATAGQSHLVAQIVAQHPGPIGRRTPRYFTGAQQCEREATLVYTDQAAIAEAYLARGVAVGQWPGTAQEAPQGLYRLHERWRGWFDVVDDDDIPQNTQALRKDAAEALLAQLNKETAL